MKNKQTSRLLIVFILADVVLLGAYGYLLSVVNTKNLETADLYTASHQAASGQEKILGLGRILKDTEKDRNKLSEYFVTKTNPVAFIEQIEKIGKNAGVDLVVSTVSDTTKDNGGIQLSFSATGSFSSVYRLIALVESMPYKVTLRKADVQMSGDQKDASGTWKGNFTVMLESFVAPSATAPANAAGGEVKK